MLVLESEGFFRSFIQVARGSLDWRRCCSSETHCSQLRVTVPYSQTGPEKHSCDQNFQELRIQKGYCEICVTFYINALFTASPPKPLPGIWVIPSWFVINHKGIVGFPYGL